MNEPKLADFLMIGISTANKTKPKKVDVDATIASLKQHYGQWYESLFPKFLDSQLCKSIIAAMPYDDDGSHPIGSLLYTMQGLRAKVVGSQFDHLAKIDPWEERIHNEELLQKEQQHWDNQQQELHKHLSSALEIFDKGTVEADPYPHRPAHHLNIEALRKWVSRTQLAPSWVLFNKSISRNALSSRPIAPSRTNGGATNERRFKNMCIVEISNFIPSQIKQRNKVISSTLSFTGINVTTQEVKEKLKTEGKKANK